MSSNFLGYLTLMSPLNLLSFSNLQLELLIWVIYVLNLLNYCNVSLLINFILIKNFEIGIFAIEFVLDLKSLGWKYLHMRRIWAFHNEFNRKLIYRGYMTTI